jgi:hypothetical protein
MSSNLPEPTTRHHNLFVKDQRVDTVIDYCIRGLQIPTGHLSHVVRVTDFDAFDVTVRSGQKLRISGQDIFNWEQDPLCVPGRDEDYDDS